VRIDRFADPEVYKKDRKLTVYGTLTGLEKHKIGERMVDYPIVMSQNLLLWPKNQDYPYYSPFYSSPWYYGGYAPYGYPYSPYYGPGYYGGGSRFNFGYGYGW
jgi:outer membrane lipoprotein